MARPVPDSRLRDLLEAATRVFIAQGYRRTQMADVAAAAGLAKGTVYLAFESKQALFHAALLHADGKAPLASRVELPMRALPQDQLLTALRNQLVEEVLPPSLAAALGRARAPDPAAELAQIVRDLYAASARHRTAIKLLERCAADHPELAKTFYAEGRFVQLDALIRYLDARIASGALPGVLDVAVAARFVIESIATWAVHIHWDPSPQPFTPEVAEDSLVQLVVRSLAPVFPSAP